MKLKVGDFVFVDSTRSPRSYRGGPSLRDWQGKGYGVITAVEDCEEVSFAQVLVGGELRWVLIEDISKDPMGDNWYLYVLECVDNTLYTGITTDVHRRLHEHNNTSRGAKYTRSRRPSRVVFCHPFDSRSSAAKAEYRFRKLTKSKKQKIIQGIDDINILFKL